MKKAFYMMAAAAIALSSCSSEETTDVAKSSAITFRPTVDFNTRGVELTKNNIQEMWVSAFKDDNSAYFNLLHYKRGTGTNGFASEGMGMPWEKGATYTFVGISPAIENWAAEGNRTIAGASASFTGIKPNDDIALQKDLVIGTAVGSETVTENVTSGVDITLEHILSQVRILVKNQNPNLIYSIAGIRIASVSPSGDYTFTTQGKNHTWTNLSQEFVTYDKTFTPFELDGTSGEAVDLTEKIGTDAGFADTDKCGAMLIPQARTPWNGAKITENAAYDKGAYIAILLSVRSKAGEMVYPKGQKNPQVRAWAAVSIPVDATKTTFEWKRSNKYIYTLDLSTGCGKVDPVKPNPGTDVIVPEDTKGDNIFGEVIKFKVDVTGWDSNNVDINGSRPANN